MLAEEIKPPKRAINAPHNWVEQKKKKGERERRNQDGTSTPKRELLKRKGTQTLEAHLIDREISQDGGNSKLPRKVQQLDSERQRKVRATQIT